MSSGNRTDISLDDPNFWQKWAKIAELEIDSKAEKVRGEGRKGWGTREGRCGTTGDPRLGCSHCLVLEGLQKKLVAADQKSHSECGLEKKAE